MPLPTLFADDAALMRVWTALPRARIVGGGVRDMLANRPVADIDLATPDQPPAVMAALRGAGLRAVPTGLQHGTVTAVADGRGFEVTTLRRDERTDGRHAEVAWTDDWREDAARRDFTINALSLSPDGRVHDYFGGIPDLRAGRLRFVGDPARRIAEDRLRVLRFFRFYGRFATQPPDPATLAALAEGAGALHLLSAERVWGELKRILAQPDPRPALALMERLGVLAAVLPEGCDRARLERLVAAGAPPDPLLRLAALVPGAADGGLAQRLRLSRDEAARLCALAGPPPDPAWDENALRRALAAEPAQALVGRAWLAGGDDPGWAGLRARLDAQPRPAFPLAGRDALAAGVAAGPRVGALLGEVRGWWLAGGCRADAEACRAELARRAAMR